MKEATKSKKLKKILIISAIIVAIVLIVFAYGWFIITEKIAEDVERVASKFTQNISISSDGTIKSGASAKELWKEMKKNGYEVDKYLDSPAELAKLLKAELVTQLPDTREDVTEEIDWDAIIKADEMSETEEKTENNEKINVLFIGNSKTFINVLDEQFQHLAESLGKQVYAARTKQDWGARTLSAFLDEDGPSQDFKQRVSEAKWDYVVLQEQTDASLDSSQLTESASRIVEYIKQNSNENVIPIYAAWSVLGDYNESDYDKATQNYETARDQTGGKVAYIAKAMLECHSKYPEIKLFDDDKLHPSAEGTYLAACCIYEAIYGESAEGATYKLGLSDDVASKLQSVAHETQEKYSSNSSSLLQGIIKFKRYDVDGNEFYLTYAEPGIFQEWVEAYNKTGNVSAKEKIATHYTLKRRTITTSSSSGNAINGTGSFTKYNLTDDELRTIAGVCVNENGEGAGACAEASLIANRYEMYGSGYSSITDYLFNCGWFAGAHAGSCSEQTLQEVATVLRDGKRTLPKYVDEHVTFSARWITSAKNSDGYISNVEDRSQYRKWETVIQQSAEVGGGAYTFYCFPTEYADPFGYTSEENRQKYGDFCYEYGTWQPINGTEDTNATDVKATSNGSSSSSNKSSTGSSNSSSSSSKSSTSSNVQSGFVPESGDGYPQCYVSSAGLKYKDFKQVEGSYQWHPYQGSTIHGFGCGVTSVAIILSGLGLNVTPLDTADGMGYTSNVGWIQSQGVDAEWHSGALSATEIANYLKEGKVLAMHYSAGSAFCANSMHFVAIVDMDSQGNFMVLNPGYTDGSGWATPAEIENLNYECVIIDTTKAVPGAFSNSSGSNSGLSQPGFQAVVGSMTNTVIKVNTIGDQVADAAEDLGITIDDAGSSSYINTTTINYEDLVQKYTLPFDLLWTLLVVGQYKGFVLQLADLAYNSEIEIGIYDNITTTEDIDKWGYTEIKEQLINGEVYYKINNARQSENVGHSHEQAVDGDTSEVSEERDEYIHKSVTTTSYNVSYAIVKADTWITDYSAEYEITEDNGEYLRGKQEIDDKEMVGWNRVGISDDKCDTIQKGKENVAKKVNEIIKNNSGQTFITADDVKTDEVKVWERQSRVKTVDNTADKTDTKKYIAKTPHLKIKDDKTTAPNFVTLLKKNKNFKSNILSATDFLFKLIAKNDKISNLLDTIKYLLYKATGVNYGVTEFDYDEFLRNNAGSSTGAATGGALSVRETSISKEEFVKLVQSYGPAVSNPGTQEFRDGAETIYDICIQEHINPVLCAAQAWAEQCWDTPVPGNYWGIAVYNGSNDGNHYDGIAGGVKGYCDLINAIIARDTSKTGGVDYGEVAKRFSAYDSHYKGDMSTIYDVFSAYAAPDGDQSDAACAAYMVEYVNTLVTIADQIFGQGVLTA